ncbi:AraC family transcriptional regulator ligand-binding domain-containing protein [Kerstersia similis]|uniref:AraC family transcriptional regulator n=1 Tax=Kerstersia similis TaxID=206505 RepID=UPI0039F139B7
MPHRADPLAVHLSPDLLEQLFLRAPEVSGRQALSMAQPYLAGAAPLTPEALAATYRQLATDMADEHLGLFLRPARPGTLKFLMLGLLDAPTLGVALHRYTHLFHILFDDFRLRLRRDASLAHISVHATDGHRLPDEAGQFLLLKLTHGIASWLIADDLPLTLLHFAFPAGARAQDYIQLFHGIPQFEQERPQFSFPRDYLDLPIRRRKPELRSFLARAPLDWLHTDLGHGLVSREVRRVLTAALPDLPALEIVASRLGLSTRTLGRRLSEEGHTFQGIKNGLRRDIAIQRIAMTDDPIADIALELGFDDPNTFYRSFRRWTGHTPGYYRQASTEPAATTATAPAGA